MKKIQRQGRNVFFVFLLLILLMTVTSAVPRRWFSFAAEANGAADAADDGVAESTGEGDDESPEDTDGKEKDERESKVIEFGRTVEERVEEITPSWPKREFLGTEIWRYCAAFVVILLGFVVMKVSDFIFERRIVPFLESTRFEFDSLFARAAGKPAGFLLLLAGIAGALGFLALPEKDPNLRGAAFGIMKILLAVDVLWFLFRSIDVAVQYLGKLAARTESALDDQLVPVIQKALKVTIGIVVSVWIVQLLGYSVSSLIAGLGIGGLAVALAFQETLGNFFGSIFIFLDRPFRVGDMVKIGDVEGIVEDIGFRSTRIRTWPATLVSIPNKTVASSVVDNLSRMPKRRVLQSIGVTYETNADQMEQAVARIRGILENDDGIDQEYMVVRFEDFGASSLDIKVLYFTTAIAYADHMEARERINLAIMRAVEELGLSIAFPTRTIYLEGDIAKGLAGMSDGVEKESGKGKHLK